ncbi:MAG: hypothetical protein R3Y67_03955 [Eubacteriales bacterium]
MLGKLLKYDFQMFFRTCGPLYAVGVAVAILNGIMMRIYSSSQYVNENFIFEQFVQFLAVGCMWIIAAIIPVAIILIISRIYKGVFGKEGYLTNTLPVSHHAILVEKIILGTITTILTAVVYVISLVLFLLIGNMSELNQSILNLLELLRSVMGGSQVILWILYYLVLGIILTISGWLTVYLSIAIGHLAKNRLIASIATYYGIQYVLIKPITFAIDLFSMSKSGNIEFQFTVVDASQTTNGVWEFEQARDYANNMMDMMIVQGIGHVTLAILTGIAAYIISARIMKNKLNLQ